MRTMYPVVLIAVVVCSVKTMAAEPSPAESRRLHVLFETEWQWGLKEAPTFATELGDKRYNDRWPDVSLEAISARAEHQKAVLKQLETFDSLTLPPADQINLQLFRKQVQADVDESAFRWYLVPVSARGGIQDENSVADGAGFDEVKDYEDWIKRLETFPRYMEQTLALMRAGVKAGLTQPKIVMQRVPAQIRRQLVDDPEKSLYFKPFLRFPDSVSTADRTRLSHLAREAITLKIVPAYREFARYFEEEYLPACRDEVGIWNVPQGDALYTLRVEQFTTTRLTPREIHEIGLSEVKRIRAEMEQVIRDVKFEGTFAEFLHHLRTDPKFYYQSPDDLMNGYLALCKRIDPELTKVFRNLPRIPYGIEAIPQNMAPDTTTAYYRPPAADGTRPGTYFVNLYRPETRPKYEMEALSLHEAVPGHHLQLALATEMTGVPTFRRFSSVTAYIEGWGLYSESLGGELGLYKDPYSKFGQLTYEMWRAVRLVVDTGMHSLHWSRDDAIKVFTDNTAKSELDIVNEVDRYIAWPGQALAYKIGELKIKELRARATRKLGNKFDLRAFHDVVLRNGAIPLDLLERQVDEWIASEQSRE